MPLEIGECSGAEGDWIAVRQVVCEGTSNGTCDYRTALAWATITLLGSTLTRSSLAAGGIGIVAFIVIGILGALPNVGRFLPTGLGAPARALALGRPGADVVGPTIATIALIAVAAMVAWLAFRRQEL